MSAQWRVEGEWRKSDSWQLSTSSVEKSQICEGRAWMRGRQCAGQIGSLMHIRRVAAVEATDAGVEEEAVVERARHSLIAEVRRSWGRTPASGR